MEVSLLFASNKARFCRAEAQMVMLKLRILLLPFQSFVRHGGRCGFCGDPVQGPFENDKGGVYDTGVIVRHYPVGLQEIEVKIEITAYHKGFFTFKLCPNNDGPITEECLNR